MLVAQLQRLHDARLFGTDQAGALPRIQTPDEGASGHRFASALNDAINQVNDAQTASDKQLESFIAGEQENLHEVMISMNQARLSFQLMVEVRNKMVDAYHELFRMQI
ncbi:MAG: flagellar hook-basal body complex protein FliE [Rhodothermales bacterium]